MAVTGGPVLAGLTAMMAGCAGLLWVSPATGYPAEPLAIDPGVRRIERFVEKPDEKRARAFIEDDKRTCKELLAHGMVQHKHNELLVSACEIIDDFMLALAKEP